MKNIPNIYFILKRLYNENIELLQKLELKMKGDYERFIGAHQISTAVSAKS